MPVDVNRSCEFDYLHLTMRFVCVLHMIRHDFGSFSLASNKLEDDYYDSFRFFKILLLRLASHRLLSRRHFFSRAAIVRALQTSRH